MLIVFSGKVNMSLKLLSFQHQKENESKWINSNYLFYHLFDKKH